MFRTTIFLLALGLMASGCTKHSLLVINNNWEFVSIKANDLQEMTAEHSYVMEFNNKKQFNLGLDVNWCGGSYRFSRNDGISFSEIHCTEACCDSAFADAAVVRLPRVDRYEISGNNLTFYGENGFTMQLKKFVP